MPEGAQKNAGLVGPQDCGRTLDANRGGGDHGLTILEKRGRNRRLGQPAISLLPSYSSLGFARVTCSRVNF
jgi:hypothetical protein